MTSSNGSLPTVSQLYPRWHLKLEDLQGKAHDVTIGQVEYRAVMPVPGQTEQKLVLHFEDRQRALILHKTNALTMAKAYGEQPEDWTGKSITIKPGQVNRKPTILITTNGSA